MATDVLNGHTRVLDILNVLEADQQLTSSMEDEVICAEAITEQGEYIADRGYQFLPK